MQLTETYKNDVKTVVALCVQKKIYLNNKAAILSSYLHLVSSLGFCQQVPS
jgi:hypothetical protein